MRLVLGMMKHETNTFSPLRTDWARFQAWGAFTGEEARKNFEKTAMPLGAYMKLARERGADFTIPMAAEAMPSGPVERDAYERMAGAICEAVAKGCDGVLLDLHGAMVTVDHEDGEGELLARIRKIAPDVPIAVTLDLHTNLTQRMVDNCTALIGYKTYPHVDMYEVAEQVGRIVLDSMAGKCRPVMAWRSLPLLSQTLRQGTDDEPMKSLIAMTRAAEAKPGVLAASVFGGFPMADIRDAGTSVITVTDGDAAQAQAVCDEIGAAAWKARESFIYQHEPLEQAVARAKTLTEGPVLLLDHADNTGSGGTQDVMTVIAEVMRQGLEDVAVAAVWDSAAVQEMARAGVGATVTIRLGGKTDMPSLDLKGEPLEITGKVKTLTDGEWVVHGPMYTGVTVQMGPTAVLDTGKVQIVIVSRHHEPWDTGVFRSVGIEPEHKRYLVLKSRIHYRAGFAGLGKATITCDGHGVTTSDNSILTFTRLRRPIYPLDRMNDDTLLPSTAQQ